MKKYLFILGLIHLVGCGEQPQSTVYRSVDYTSNSEQTLMIIGSEGSATASSCGSDFTNNVANMGTLDCSIDIVNLQPCALGNLRDWIGFAPNTNAGFTRAQTFTFTNLVPNQLYSLKISILVTASAGIGKAMISGGEIASGGTFDFSIFKDLSCSPIQTTAWKITFKSASTTATLRISNDATSGSSYFYPDYYVISKN